MDYSDLQVTTIIGTSRVTDNAADARIRGLEVETQFLPAEGLTTALSYAYTDAKYRDYIDGSGRDLSGNKFPGVSRHVINLRADRKSTRLNPVTNAQLVCRLLLEKKKYQWISNETRYL